jgi:hypothetical protein
MFVAYFHNILEFQYYLMIYTKVSEMVTQYEVFRIEIRIIFAPLLNLHFIRFVTIYILGCRGFMPWSHISACQLNYNIVVYRPVAKRGLCKQRPLLCNGTVNTPLQQELCFLCGPCRDVISKEQVQFSHFCTGICEVRTWAGGRGIAVVGAVTRKLLATNREH